MEFNLHSTIQILERTPGVLEQLLQGLATDWTHSDEGPDTWTAYDILGHLIHGERTDWIPRMQIILSGGPDHTFAPFDRFAQFEASKGQSLADLLQTFRRLREQNIATLRAQNLSPEDYSKTGIHPALGKATLAQLLATWAVHDLNHIGQLARVMASQYKEAVGPWVQYLGILQKGM